MEVRGTLPGNKNDFGRVPYPHDPNVRALLRNRGVEKKKTLAGCETFGLRTNQEKEPKKKKKKKKKTITQWVKATWKQDR